MSTNEQRDGAEEEPARKTPRLARPPPTEERRQVSHWQVSVKTEFIKLMCGGHAVFRPSLSIRCNAEHIRSPEGIKQIKQTLSMIRENYSAPCSAVSLP